MFISILSVCLSISSSYDHQTTPKLHVSGYDTTNKDGTKHMGLKTALEFSFNFLHSFGQEPLTEEMIMLAEPYLVRYMSTNPNTTTFDELRYLKLV